MVNFFKIIKNIFSNSSNDNNSNKGPRSLLELGVSEGPRSLLELGFSDRIEEEMKNNNYKSALKLCDHYLNYTKSQFVKSEIYFFRGNANQNLNDYNESIKDYTESIKLYPDNIDAINNRGTAYLKIRKFNEAIEDFNEVLKLDPKYAMAWNNRGFTYYLLEQYDLALSDLNNSVHLDDNVELTHFNLAKLYHNIQKYENSINECNLAIKLNPRNSHTYLIRGNSLYKLNKFCEASDDYNKAKQMGSGTLGALYDICSEEICNYLNEIKLKPNDINLRTKLAKSFINFENYDMALNELNIVLEKHPGSIEGLLYNSISKFNKSKYDEALEDINKAISLIKLDNAFSELYGRLFYSRAMIKISINNYAEANNDLLNAVSYKTVLDDDINYAFGLINYYMKNYQKSIEYFKKSVDDERPGYLNETIEKKYYILGLCKIELNDKEKGIEDIKYSAKLGYIEAQKYLKNLEQKDIKAP